jgi:hypothetical protein
MTEEFQYGDAPAEDRFKQTMIAIMKTVDEFMNGENCPPSERKVAIAMLMFPFGEDSGRCNYMSNGIDRRDMEKLLFEQAKRFRKQRLDTQRGRPRP